MLAGGSYLDDAARFGAANSTVFAAHRLSPFVFGCSLGLIKGRRYLASYDRKPPRTATPMLLHSSGCA